MTAVAEKSCIATIQSNAFKIAPLILDSIELNPVK